MELISTQEENSQQLQQAIKNFKKSPLDRKTLTYLQQQLDKLTNLWEQFNNTDKLIRKNPNIPETHDYYSSRHYEQVGEMFSSIATKIKEEIKEFKTAIPSAPPRNPAASSSQSANSKVVVSKLPIKLQKGISAVKELLRKADDGDHSAQFSTMQLHTIEQHWTVVTKLHEQLWTTATDDYDIEEFVQEEAEINKEIFFLSERIRLAETTAKPENNVNEQSSVKSHGVKLPTIELPIFDGNFMKWRQFKDLFSEMVHNQQLSNVQKLWYLKGSLTGEASRLIQHLSTTSENYTSAWQIVTNRYENKRLIVGTTLQRLLSQQSVQKDSAASIKQLHDNTLECLLGLQALGLNTDSWDPILVHILLQLLDRQTQLLWEQSLDDPRELPKLQDLMKFLELRFQSMEAIGPAKRFVQSSSSLITTTNTCIACRQSHSLFQCQKFKEMGTKQRLQLVQNARGCVNCLKNDHSTKQCPSTSNCQRCNKRHNTLLHLHPKSTKKEYPTAPSKNADCTNPLPSASSLFTASPKGRSSVLLSTVVIIVDNAFGQQVECRAILDSGSQVHLITKDFANKLELQQLNHKLRIQGIGETNQHASKSVNVHISSRITSFTSSVEALIVPKIVAQQPRRFINIQNWTIPKNIKLGDPQFNIPEEVDMLIGAEIFYSILSIGQVKLGKGMPTLQNSLFGWLIGGEHPLNDDSDDALVCGIHTTNDELFTAMERFWEVEECSAPTRQMTSAEIKCEDHFRHTHNRASDDRFVVKLPFQGDRNTLGESYGIALQRLRGVERRLSKDKQLHQEYIKFLREYQELGHMEEISTAKLEGPHYFLPHHAVLKPDSTSTKVRVVFDASAKTSNNISLNDVLAIGPSIQDDVFSQLLRFRFPRYVFTADIEKMYRQIWVHEDDRRFQLILWRENPDQPIKMFQLNTVTYGTSCAPYLAIRCLRQLALDGSEKYPLASEIVNKNFYVDDVLAGSDDIKTAVDKLCQLRELLSTAGLHLRKWCANDQRLLRHVPEVDREVNLDLNKAELVKTMGLIWSPKEDCFSIKCDIKPISRVTKRNILAEISRIFDPLGFIAPITITTKIFLQELWKLKLDWDASLPQDLHTKWIIFRQELCNLNQIKVARHSFGHEVPRSIEIHIFADASEKAYGAVAYVRTISTTNLVVVRILCAKSKVAPTKQTTLPRLELCAAKLATDLMKRIHNDLDIDKARFHLWSDSTAVLGWINAQSSNYHTFIANRIAAIQRTSNGNQWHYIPSKENPADMLSRGLYPSQLINNNLWFYGPKVLHGNSDTWINEKLKVDCSLELRRNTQIALPLYPTECDILSNIRHNNSFRKLQRIVAYMLRFSKPKLPGSEILGDANLVIRPNELQIAVQRIIKYVQKSEFQHHITEILKNGWVQHNSSLSHLSPFLDEHGILRVGGRLQAADLSYDAKHPMLLSHKHPITKLIMLEIHRDNMHAGVQTMLAISRQRFWIINGKTLARNITHNCVSCVRYKPKLAEQIMGQLPKDRVTAARPFLVSGVDFFGPVYVHFKSRGKRPTKAYGAVFCCFVTKAVHLELVSDLTTEAFIGALKRFTGRRGLCQKLYCDNATNFIGTKNALAAISETIHSETAKVKILTECSRRNIEFCFIPPRAPHFGGLWEAAVKSAKNLLHSSLSAASLTYEEMETVMIDAEAILNSRPLTPLSSDPNDLAALTPGHFLIGEPLTAVADSQLSVNRMTNLTRWNLVRHLKHEFWRRWSLEYLNGLQNRHKWNQQCQNIKIGTMVIIKEENLPPLKWPLGRIERVIPGEDGHIRVVDVRTSTNISRRPIHKLAPLPVEEEILKVPEQVIPRNGPISTNSTRKRKSSSSIATLLLTCLLLPFTSAVVTFTPFEGEPGIYFERIGMANIISSSWNIVNFVELKPLQQELKLTQTYAKTLKDICNIINTSSCQGTIHQLTHLMEMINTKNSLLIHNQRSKRGAFNIIGSFANTLFGVLDSEYAEKLSSTITNLKENDASFKRYVENQTMFLDRTLTLMKRNEDQIKREFDALDDLIEGNKNSIQKLTQETHREQLATQFNMLALQAFMQVTRFQSVQDALIDIVTDSHHGTINPELITPYEFQEQLHVISIHSAKYMRLPLPIEDVAQYYHITTITHQITEDYIMFNLKIPVISDKKFELLKLTAIPWANNNTLFKLSLATPYILVDLLRENHVPMTTNELQRCVTINQTVYFCPQLQPTHTANSTDFNCELSILKTARVHSDCHPIQCIETSYWRPLHLSNAWLIAVRSNEVINAVCGNIPSQIEVHGSGILKLDDGCTVRTSTITIEGHEEVTSTRQIVYVPACNISQVSIKPAQIAYNFTRSSYTVDVNINTLKEELHNIKAISLNKIRTHDIHHYGLGYTVLILIICCLICIAWLHYKQGSLPRSDHPTPAPRNRTQSATSTESRIIFNR